MAQSHYKKTESFILNFPVNFIITVNVAFQWTLTSFVPRLKDPTLNQSLEKKVLNLGLKTLFNLVVSIWKKTTMTLQGKFVKITQINNNT